MGGKYVIIKYQQKTVSLLYQDNRLVRARAENEAENILGNIYVAKVKNVVKSIRSAFVEIAPGYPCFLNLDDARKPLILNRSYDGRVLAGDDILVQVYKEAAKTKSPSVSSSLSLDGKYCVVSTGKPGVAYSAKLSEKVKKRIGDALAEEKILEEYGKSQGIVIRTNARSLLEDISPLAEEIRHLSEKLCQIVGNAPYRTCYSLLYEKPSAYLIGLRDEYEGQFEEIVTDDKDIFENISKYAATHPGYGLPGIRFYQDDRLPLYKLYRVESSLQEALQRKVWLKSGGYLIIEPTEALTVIDVNTGKMTAGKDTEQTYWKTNMEAAKEIALQLSLRNISGIILVDFINMRQEEHNKELMSVLGNLLKKDPVRTKLVDITALGLVEITRMKTSRPLWEQLGMGKGKRESDHEAD